MYKPGVLQLKYLFLLVEGKGLFVLRFLKVNAYDCVACCTWLLWNECKLVIIFVAGHMSTLSWPCDSMLGAMANICGNESRKAAD
jgi:hypothetical protein